MAITVQPSSQFTTQFPPGSVNIKFSQLRDVFKSTLGSFTPVGPIIATGNIIRASELKRDTNVTPASGQIHTDPVVPDSTENAAISTGNDWKVSQFRGSIKFYVINQTGTDTNLNINTMNWNGNLNRSIRKFLTVNGTTGATSNANFAINFSDGARNLNVYMQDGSRAYGSGGAGGTAASRNGAYGGDAIRIISNTGRVRVYLYPSTNVYGGGGGGAKGATGDTGPSGGCPRRETYETGCNCGGCPGCAGGWSRFGCPSCGGCNCGKGGCRSTQYRAQCERTVFDTRPGAPGGEGGNGGSGRGWNNLSGSTSGSGGASGTTAGCNTYGPAPGSNGRSGESGGGGGDWASSGASTDQNGSGTFQGNGGSGGGAGRAVTGSNYSVEGSLNSSTIRGLYNP